MRFALILQLVILIVSARAWLHAVAALLVILGMLGFIVAFSYELGGFSG